MEELDGLNGWSGRPRSLGAAAADDFSRDDDGAGGSPGDAGSGAGGGSPAGGSEPDYKALYEKEHSDLEGLKGRFDQEVETQSLTRAERLLLEIGGGTPSDPGASPAARPDPDEGRDRDLFKEDALDPDDPAVLRQRLDRIEAREQEQAFRFHMDSLRENFPLMDDDDVMRGFRTLVDKGYDPKTIKVEKLAEISHRAQVQERYGFHERIVEQTLGGLRKVVDDPNADIEAAFKEVATKDTEAKRLIDFAEGYHRRKLDGLRSGNPPRVPSGQAGVPAGSGTEATRQIIENPEAALAARLSGRR